MVVPPASVRVLSERPLAPRVVSRRALMISVIMKWSRGLCTDLPHLTYNRGKSRKISTRRPFDEGAVRPIIVSNGVPFLEMMFLGSQSTSGWEKEGKRKRKKERTEKVWSVSCLYTEDCIMSCMCTKGIYCGELEFDFQVVFIIKCINRMSGDWDWSILRNPMLIYYLINFSLYWDQYLQYQYNIEGVNTSHNSKNILWQFYFPQL